MTASTTLSITPTVDTAPPRRVLFRQAVCRLEEFPEVIGQAFSALYAELARAGVEPDGPPFVIYNNMPSDGGSWDIDICAPVASAMTAPEGFRYREMPAGQVVTVLHVGPYDGLAATYDRLERYLAENTLTPSGPPREFYLSEPDVPPAETRTLIERPI